MSPSAPKTHVEMTACVLLLLSFLGIRRAACSHVGKFDSCMWVLISGFATHGGERGALHAECSLAEYGLATARLASTQIFASLCLIMMDSR